MIQRFDFLEFLRVVNAGLHLQQHSLVHFSFVPPLKCERKFGLLIPQLDMVASDLDLGLKFSNRPPCIVSITAISTAEIFLSLLFSLSSEAEEFDLFQNLATI